MNLKYFSLIIFLLFGNIVSAQNQKILFSLDAGFYDSAQKLSLKSIPGTEIYYTLDGSEPTAKSLKYRKPIILKQTTVVKALAIDKNGNCGKSKTATYFIGERDFTLPVVSIASDSIGLFSDTSGIYVKGTRGIAGRCCKEPMNWNQDWSRFASFEYFVDKKQIVCQNVDLKMYGNCSRRKPQKSFRIIANKEYGKGKLNYKFFESKDIDEFKNIVLRNSGGDWDFTMFRDALVQEICRERFDIDYLAYQPTVVFLNGKYWGLYNIREKFNKVYLKENYGVDKNSVSISSVDFRIDSSYVAFSQNLKKMNLKSDTLLQYVSSVIDLNEFVDYCILEIYVYNYDWPRNNMRWWQTTDSKWRWVLFDADCAWGLLDVQPSANFFEKMNTKQDARWRTYILDELLQNDTFRKQFVDRYKYHLQNTFRTEYLNHKIDSLQNLIAPEIAYSKKRWAADSLKQNDLEYFRNAWLADINVVRDWISIRNEAEYIHLKEYFGLAQVAISSQNPKINRVEVNGKMVDLPYTDYYFPEIELKISTAGTEVAWLSMIWNKQSDMPIMQQTESTDFTLRVGSDDVILTIGEK